MAFLMNALRPSSILAVAASMDPDMLNVSAEAALVVSARVRRAASLARPFSVRRSRVRPFSLMEADASSMAA